MPILPHFPTISSDPRLATTRRISGPQSMAILLPSYLPSTSLSCSSSIFAGRLTSSRPSVNKKKITRMSSLRNSAFKLKDWRSLISINRIWLDFSHPLDPSMKFHLSADTKTNCLTSKSSTNSRKKSKKSSYSSFLEVETSRISMLLRNKDKNYKNT